MDRGQCAGNQEFQIGAGIHDITGPAAGRQMLGYVNLFAQTTGGIHMRLRSRAFVIASPCNNQRVLFVSADLGMVFHAVKKEVVKRLQARFGPELYKTENVIISATHTHAGPGGYSHHLLYNAISLSFDPRNFEVIVNGIYESAVKAHENLTAGSVRIGTGQLANASKNRSPRAYDLNLDKDDGPNVDRDLAVLRLTANDAVKTEVGAINWFAVHGTSLRKQNKLISGDNKGLASYLFEKAMGTDYAEGKTFVSAFAQSNEGDVSPNVFGGKEGRGGDEFEGLETSATLQYRAARGIYDGASEQLTGGVEFRHVYLDFAGTEVSDAWTHAGPQRTCSGAIGVSKLAGAEDGRGPPIMSEGVSTSNFSLPRRIVTGVARWVVLKIVKLALRLFAGKNPARALVAEAMATRPQPSECQAEKPVFLATGAMRPDAWTPSVLPLQLVTIGQLAIVAVPFECTTMAGRRIRAAVRSQLEQAGVKHYVIAGLANDYGGYMTTREEYARQDYEGASTEFGPWQLAATQQTLADLAGKLRDGEDVGPGPEPVEPSRIFDLPDLLEKDASPPLRRFGDTHENPHRRYRQGDVVKVSFWAGHPANDLLTQATFLEVQRRNGGSWATVARDWDPETRFLWKRCFPFLPYALSTLEWHLPRSQTPGTYRIVHHGHARTATHGVEYYHGESRDFEVVARSERAG